MPRVAVVIATRDRADRLARLLDALRAQDVDDVELVVVDDASQDATPTVLARVRDLPLTVITEPAPVGPSVARDDGWQQTTAPLVAFTDDDCEPAPGWLAALLAAHEAQPDALLQGPVAPLAGERDRLGPGARTQRVDALGPFFQCANVAYPRAVLEAVGGFDRSYGWGGEDTDLAWRVLEAGTPARWVPDAQVGHAVRMRSPRELVREADRFAGAMRLLQRHPELARRALVHRVFFKDEHRLLLQAVAGLAMTRRLPPAALLALPYARSLRARAEGQPRWLAPLIAFDAWEMQATARSGAYWGRLVL